MNSLSSSCLPSQGLLREYLDYAEPLTDAPVAYHLFVGLSVLAVTVSNRVWLPFGAQRIYPNLYTVLLGPTSFYRKSSAIAIGRGLLDNFDEHLILPDEFSRERLYEKLASKPQGLLIWSEFGGALENFNREYMLGTKEFFSDLFDCRPKYRRELRGNQVYEITNPCISILSASTPSWLQSRIREADILGGFFPRFLYVSPGLKTKWLAIPPPPDKSREARLLMGLRKLKDLTGEVDLGQTCAAYESWVRNTEGDILKHGDSDFLAGFYARLSIYALKLAILYHVAEERNLVLSSGAMSKALLLSDYLKTGLAHLFTGDLAFTREGQDKARAMGLIERIPGIDHSDLLRRFRHGARRLKEAVATLIQEERIRREPQGGRTSYFPWEI